MGYNLRKFRKQNTEGEKNISSSSSYSLRNARDYSTIAEDEAKTRSTLANIYGGWQDAQTMADSRASVQNMYNTLNRYKSFKQTNDFDDVIGAYKNALDNWDSITEYYGKFKNADAYNAEAKKAQYYKDNPNLSYLDVRAKMSQTDENSDEYGYLKEYGMNAGFNSASDYDAMLGYLKDNGEKDLYDKTNAKKNQYELSNGFNEYKKYMQNSDFDAESQKEAPKTAFGRKNVTDLATIKNMTDEERAVGNYIYNTRGEDAYWNYMDDMAMSVGYRDFNADTENLQEWLQGHPGRETLYTIGSYLTNAASYIPVAVEQGRAFFTDEEYNPYMGASGIQNRLQSGRSAISADIASATDFELPIIGNVGAAIYDVTNSTIDSALGAFLYGHGFAPLMGTSAFNSTYKEAVENGLNPDNAVETAILSGLAETTFEYVSLEHLLQIKNAKNAKQFFINFIGQSIAEGSEEVNTEIANKLSDIWVNGNASDYARRADELRSYGYSDSEIKKMINSEYVKDILKAGIEGSLSGALMGGVQTALQTEMAREQGVNVDYEALKKTINDAEFGEELKSLEEKYPNRNGLNYYTELGTIYSKALEKTGQTLNEKETNEERSQAFKDYINLLKAQKSDAQIKAEKQTRKYTAEKTSYNGKEVALLGMTEDGKVKTSEGDVDIKDLDLSSKDATVVVMASDMSDKMKADAFVANYKGQNLTEYEVNFNLAFVDGRMEGKEGITVNQMLEDIDTSVIGPMEATKIFESGKASVNVASAKVDTVGKEILNKYRNVAKKGKFDVTAIEGMELTSTEKAILRIAEAFSVMGVNVRVIKNIDAISINGKFDRGNNEVIINLAARYSANGDIFDRRYVLPTMAHEFTHWMEKKAAPEFKQLQDLIFGFYGEKKTELLIAQEQKRFEEKHEGKLSRADAISEVMARACEDMLSDGKVLEDILSRASRSTLESLKAKVMEFFENMKAFLKDLMDGYASFSEAARYLRANQKVFEQAQKLWANAFDKALQFSEAVEESTEQTEDVRATKSFNLKETIELNENSLMAYHNLSEENLLKSIELGGFALPSIAIKRAVLGHTDYGDISVIFPKSVIDPKRSSKNAIYSGDAWTPTFPSVDYKVSESKQREIEAKVKSLVGDAYGILGSSRLSLADMQDAADRGYKGEEQLIKSSLDNNVMKYAFLADKGEAFDIPMTAQKYSSEFSNEQLGAMALVLGDDILSEINKDVSGFYRNNSEVVDRIRLMLNEAYLKNMELSHPGNEKISKLFANRFGKDGELSFADFDKFTRAMRQVRQGEKKIVDTVAFKEKLSDINEAEYKDWLTNLFNGIIEKNGIRNNLDWYTPSGNRRSWDALHWELTLENVVKAMLKEEQQGSVGFFDAQNIWGVATKKYSSIDAMKKEIGRLVLNNEEERKALRTAYTERLVEISRSIMNTNRDSMFAMDEAASAVVDSLRGAKTVESIDKRLRDYSDSLHITDHTAQDVLDLYNDILKMPTGYFEAKPQRAVGLSEIAYVVIPSDSSSKLIKALDDNGIAHYEYARNDLDFADRINVTNEAAKGNADVLFNDKINETIYEGMDEHERATILSKSIVTFVKASFDANTKAIIESIPNVSAREARQIVKAVAEKYGIFTQNLSNENLNIKFEFSGSSLEESRNIQASRGGSYYDLANAIANLDRIAMNSIPIEVHKDHYKETLREDPSLEKVYVLVGGYYDSEYLHPVQLEIKEFIDKDNKLYIVVTLSKIKASVSGQTPTSQDVDEIPSLASIEISLPQVIGNVNVSDKDFLRYIPDEMLNEKQIEAKQESWKKLNEKIERLKEGKRSLNSDKVDSEGNSLSEQQIEFFKDSKVRDAEGRLLVMWHGTSTPGFSEFDTSKTDDNRSFFFTDSKKIAESYSGNDDEISVSSKVSNDYMKFLGKKGVGANYKVYLNIVNPLVIDAKGSPWFDISSDNVPGFDSSSIIEYTNWKSVRNKNDGTVVFEYDIKGKHYVTEPMTEAEAISKFGKGFTGKAFERKEISYSKFYIDVNNKQKVWIPNTRNWSKYAKDNGYDGVIIKNVKDANSSVQLNDFDSTVTVCFYSNQIKSVKNENPTSNSDIRYSDKIDEEVTEDNTEANDYATFNGKKFWSGSVSLLDGTIEEVHTYEEAVMWDFHHSYYFSEEAQERMDNEESAFFYINGKDVDVIDWRTEIPQWVKGRIKEQIEIGGKKLYSDKVDSEGNALTEEQVEYFKDSKVRDENGRLKIMYHGTQSAGFTVFDRDFSDDGLSFFFTDDLKVARGYSGSSELKLPKSIKTAEEFNEYANKLSEKTYDYYTKYEFKIEKNGDKYDLFVIWKKNNGYELVERSRERFVVSSYDEAAQLLDTEYGNNDGQANYGVYLNLVNPFILDADNNQWDEIPFNNENATTRDIALYANNNGYDGVIIENLFDNGGMSNYQGSSTVVIAFNSNQIKSVANTNPTSDADIRYSDKVDSDVADLLGKTKQIEAENKRLKADVERLNKVLKLNRTVTKGMVLKDSQLDVVARVLLKDANSKMDKAELISGLKEVYGYILENSSTEGKEVNWDVLMGKAFEVARKLMAESKPDVIEDAYYKGILKDIRKSRVRLDEQQIAEAKNWYGERYRDAFMGKVILVKDGISLDSQWQEWSTMYPDIFDADMNSADMPGALLDIYDDVKEMSETLQYYNDYESIKAMAVEIYEKFWNVDTVNTMADKHKAEVLKLKADHRQAMTELKAKADEQTLADKMYYNKLLKKLRDKNEAEKAELKEYMKKKNAERKDAILRKAQIEKITDTALTLGKWLTANSVKEHIPTTLQAPVKALISAIDFSSKQLLGMRGGENAFTPTKKDISISKALEKVRDVVTNAEKAQTDSGVAEGLDTYIDFPPQYAEDINKISQAVNEIERRIHKDNAYILNEMSLEDLKSLAEAVTVMKHCVTGLNKLISTTNAHSVDYFAQGTIQEASEHAQRKKEVSKLRKYGQRFLDFIDFQNGVPYYVTKRLGPSAHNMFKLLVNGQDKFAFNIKEVVDFAEGCYTTEEANKWLNEVNEFDILEVASDAEKAEGQENRERHITMTTAQIMSLYCLSKREQAKGHIFGGGIVINGYDTKFKHVAAQKGVTLTDSELDKILKVVTENPRVKEVADNLQLFMNTVCQTWGNEVSMKRFGIEAFTEENYFPIASDSNVTNAEPRDSMKSIYALLNMSFTKSLVKNANNRIVIDDIFNTFTIHAGDMAKYNAIALPVLDYVKWFNYKEKVERGDAFETITVKGALDDAFGAEASKYIRHLLYDLNGQAEMGRGEGLIKKFTKGYKIAAVGANLQVALLQPTSYLRATYVMDEKYLLKALTRKPSIAKCKEHCGLALWKSFGFYNTDVSRGLDAMIKHSDTIKDKLVEKSNFLAEKADEITWGTLWNACEAEIMDKNPSLAYNSEEFNKAVADRLTDVILATQVVDSTLTRSDLMRSTSMAIQAVTAFQSEPTLSLNMLNDARTEFTDELAKSKNLSKALSKSGKKIAKASEAYLLTSVLESCLRAGMSKLRNPSDDEDDEYIKLVIQNFKDELNVLNKIPIVKEVFEYLDGYSSTRMDMAAIESSVSAFNEIIKVIFKGKEWSYKTTYKLITAISQGSGLPLSNALREIAMVWNNTIGLMYPDLRLLK